MKNFARFLDVAPTRFDMLSTSFEVLCSLRSGGKMHSFPPGYWGLGDPDVRNPQASISRRS